MSDKASKTNDSVSLQQSAIRTVEQLGASHAALIDVKSISFDQSFRSLCASNACGNYGKCWTCPPDAGDIDFLIQRAKSYRYALVYQSISPLEDSFDYEGMQAAAVKHNALCRRVTKWAKAQSFRTMLSLGAGGCHVCAVCAKRTNDPCRHPEEALSSLETYGIDVSRLAQQAGLRYINGSNTVTFFGAVLFDIF